MWLETGLACSHPSLLRTGIFYASSSQREAWLACQIFPWSFVVDMVARWDYGINLVSLIGEIPSTKKSKKLRRCRKLLFPRVGGLKFQNFTLLKAQQFAINYSN